MKYIFKQIDNISGHCAETTVEFSADYLPNILEHFEMFLRGSGFNPSGTLDFVPDEEYYGEIPDFDPAAEEYVDYENYEDYESPNEICERCGLTRRALGDNMCYDINCGLK